MYLALSGHVFIMKGNGLWRRFTAGGGMRGAYYYVDG